VNSAIKYVGSLIEYLDHGGLDPALVIREQGDKLVIRDQLGHERTAAAEEELGQVLRAKRSALLLHNFPLMKSHL
jgi:hypothetical protein